MPFDTLAQFEGQPGSVLAPRPALGQVGDDRIEAVLRPVLVVKHQVVLNTAIIGIETELVASSWIDMLAGLSR